MNFMFIAMQISTKYEIQKSMHNVVVVKDSNAIAITKSNVEIEFEYDSGGFDLNVIFNSEISVPK